MRAGFAVGVLCALVISCSSPRESQEPEDIRPKVQLTHLDGTTIDWADFEGKTVILNFWATWCKPCIVEMPTLVEMENKLPKDKYILLLASNEEPSKINDFILRRSYPLNFIRLISSPESLGVYSLPTTFVIGEDGVLQRTIIGTRDWGRDETIGQLLKNTLQ